MLLISIISFVVLLLLLFVLVVVVSMYHMHKLRENEKHGEKIEIVFKQFEKKLSDIDNRIDNNINDKSRKDEDYRSKHGQMVENALNRIDKKINDQRVHKRDVIADLYNEFDTKTNDLYNHFDEQIKDKSRKDEDYRSKHGQMVENAFNGIDKKINDQRVDIRDKITEFDKRSLNKILRYRRYASHLHHFKSEYELTSTIGKYVDMSDLSIKEDRIVGWSGDADVLSDFFQEHLDALMTNDDVDGIVYIKVDFLQLKIIKIKLDDAKQNQFPTFLNKVDGEYQQMETFPIVDAKDNIDYYEGDTDCDTNTSCLLEKAKKVCMDNISYKGLYYGTHISHNNNSSAPRFSFVKKTTPDNINKNYMAGIVMKSSKMLEKNVTNNFYKLVEPLGNDNKISCTYLGIKIHNQSIFTITLKKQKGSGTQAVSLLADQNDTMVSLTSIGIEEPVLDENGGPSGEVQIKIKLTTNGANTNEQFHLRASPYIESLQIEHVHVNTSWLDLEIMETDINNVNPIIQDRET
jgi:putative transposon-encoded protein